MRKQIDQINIQAKLWNFLPTNIIRILNVFRVMPRYLNWSTNRKGRKHSQNVLATYKDKFKGYRCIVIGNGPSLNKMDLSILKNEFTFGMNRIYMLFEEWGFETSFLVSINRFVLEQFSNDLSQLNMLKFFNWAYREPFFPDEKTVFLTPKPRYVADGNICEGYYPSLTKLRLRSCNRTRLK